MSDLCGGFLAHSALQYCGLHQEQTVKGYVPAPQSDVSRNHSNIMSELEVKGHGHLMSMLPV